MTSRKVPFPLVCIAASLLAQACVQYVPDEGVPPPPPPPPPYPAPSAEVRPVAPARDVREVDALMAPIALYPDPLIAILLPASTQPAEISAAAAYLVQYGSATGIDSQPWDPSVRALAHYPTVLAWMAQNLPWTEALGSEFASSPEEAMDSIQRLRARAWAAGTLTTTPQQQVFSDDGAIDILPAQDDELFVPAYDPNLMYPDEPYYGSDGPFMVFGGPFPAGIWLAYSFDWHRHRVWEGDHGGWHKHGGWHPHPSNGDQPPPGARPWHPRRGGPGTAGPGGGPHGAAASAPRPMTGAPHPQATRTPAVIPRPVQHAPAARPAPAAPEGPTTPRDRPRLGVTPAPAAGQPAQRQAATAPASGTPKPQGTDARATPPQGPAGTTRTNRAQAPARPAPPPVPRGFETRAPAPAPSRAQAAPAAAHSAPAPAPAASAPSSSSSGSDRQPQK